ncbi:hypothetical protein Asp14428_48660 [Actinoplanes sp. NBRC 14428]|nr:hypothetical protein Asp14428_48660 [Actinoplanes sp. NBRC 14428]
MVEREAFDLGFTSESSGIAVLWPVDASQSVSGLRREYAKRPSQRAGFVARAAVAASMTGVALAGVTAPGLTAIDPFSRFLSSSVHGWQGELEEEVPEISWADVVAASTEDFLAIEAKRAALAEREAALFDSYELDDEDWTA